jgi:quercetin dioxygenase-like cupin family protein
VVIKAVLGMGVVAMLACAACSGDDAASTDPGGPRVASKSVASGSHETTEPVFDETVSPVFQHEIPNIDGRSMVAEVVSYPPGGASPSHRHAGSAFIYAYVLSGAIRSQVGDEPPTTYHIGQGFYEDPGSHHRVSENASATEPASMLVVFIVDPHDGPLTTADGARDLSHGSTDRSARQ